MTKSAKPHLDNFDRRILEILQNDASLSHAEIGDAVMLSASSVRRRIEALKAKGVIRKIVALVEPEARKPMSTAVIMVTFDRETPDGYAEFAKRMLADDYVVQCHIVSGQFDAMLIVATPTLDDYWTWAKQTLTADRNVRRFETAIVLSALKSPEAIVGRDTHVGAAA